MSVMRFKVHGESPRCSPRTIFSDRLTFDKSDAKIAYLLQRTCDLSRELLSLENGRRARFIGAWSMYQGYNPFTLVYVSDRNLPVTKDKVQIACAL